MNVSNLTPSEKRLYDALADGDKHTKDELRKLMDLDEYTSDQGFWIHIFNLRRKLEVKGLGINWSKKTKTYQLVRFISE